MRRLACIALLVVGSALGAPDVAALVAQLDSPEWGERQLGEERLSTVDGVTVEDLFRAMGGDGLSVEQRTRLERAAAARFRGEPMAGLGVQFGGSSEGAVTIQSVVRGFPAGAVLQAGDVIVAVGETIVGGQDHLRAEILSRRAGDTLPLLVRRDRQLLEMDVPLGAFQNLDTAQPVDDATIARAMRLRMERRGLRGDEPDGVGAALDMEGWVGAAFPEGRDGVANDPGERRGSLVKVGGARGDEDLGVRTRGFWTTRAAALTATREALRGELGRLMTNGVRLRAVFVEHERSLTDRIARAKADGGDAASLEATLERTRARMGAIDQRLGEIARSLDAAQP